MKPAVPALISLLLFMPVSVVAQPTVLEDCLGVGGDPTACSDIAAGTLLDFWCPGGARLFETYEGRLAWNPLRYVAPIMIEVNALETDGTRFPLFIEFVTVEGRPPDLGYCDGPGQVIMTVHGSLVCTGWEIAGPIHLDPFVNVGDRYVIRAHFFGDSRIHFESPYLACIRVRPQSTSDVPDVVTPTWSLVKGLYR